MHLVAQVVHLMRKDFGNAALSLKTDDKDQRNLGKTFGDLFSFWRMRGLLDCDDNGHFQFRTTLQMALSGEGAFLNITWPTRDEPRLIAPFCAQVSLEVFEPVIANHTAEPPDFRRVHLDPGSNASGRFKRQMSDFRQHEGGNGTDRLGSGANRRTQALKP